MFDVVFVCLGNICRSPMAEAVFSRIAKERGVALSFRISSRATSDCEEGNPVYPPAMKVLKSHGYDFSHRAVKLGIAGVKNADYVLVMDDMNLSDVTAMTCGRYAEKIFKLGFFDGWKNGVTDVENGRGKDIDDPWYTRDFERAYSDITDGCKGFLKFLKSEKASAFAYDGAH